MISAATGAMALVMVTLVKDHGLQYLFAPTFLTGALQIIAGRPKLAVLMRFVSRSVISGFVNALASLRDGRCRARHHLSVSESRIYAPDWQVRVCQGRFGVAAHCTATGNP